MERFLPVTMDGSRGFDSHTGTKNIALLARLYSQGNGRAVLY
jgi:hypothetical protein